ncbi:hypothetical protein HMI54_006533 [Coelomomyces lativittatus]|nr:hypothetical protein HMI54_006533 [Coelomomyces lativittatus]KAJ1505367.1 hypothetical protein HMI55_001623 [Coelomomyces lativittatus]
MASFTPQHTPVDPPIYFNAGPGPFPPSVLKQAQSSLLQLDPQSPSILTLSHRSPQFDQILKDAEDMLRSLLDLPLTHVCLWIQGGATLQFSMIPMHFLHMGGKTSKNTPLKAHYYVTGTWSKKAKEEAVKLGVEVYEEDPFSSSSPNPLSQQPSTFTTPMPSASSISYTYFCSNETVDGIEWDGPSTFQGKLVADMSSNFLSKPIPNIQKFDLIFAGVQKNLGPAGVTLVILKKEEWMKKEPNNHPHSFDTPLPTLLEYTTYIHHRSLYNTPPVFSIYVCYLMLIWLTQLGGLETMGHMNQQKASLLYTALAQSPHMWVIPKHHGSQMNIVFRIGDRATHVPDPKMERQFVRLAEQHGLHGLEGHRSVGGLRASLYNAITVEQVQHLVDFIHWFDETGIHREQ